MKSNKFKFTFYYDKDSFNFIIYRNSSTRQMAYLHGKLVNSIFEIDTYKEYNKSYREWMRDRVYLSNKNIKFYNRLAGSINFTDSVYEYYINIISMSFWRRSKYIRSLESRDITLETNLFFDLIKKHGKFHGKKEKFFNQEERQKGT